MGDVPPSYLGRISFPSEQRLVGSPELDQPFHILFSHWEAIEGVKGQKPLELKTSSLSSITYFYSCVLGTEAVD